MSMILSLKQAPAATLDLLVERPELAVVFWMDPRYKPLKQPGWVKWIARYLGGYTPPMELPEAPPELVRDGKEYNLDKAWHGLQWLLTKPKSRTEGDEWEVPPPEGTLLSGGKPLAGSDHGYGDDRAVSPAELAAFDDLLQGLEASEVGARFDAAALDAAQVYPTPWTDADRPGWMTEGFSGLKAFVHATREKGLGVVIKLS